MGAALEKIATDIRIMCRSDVGEARMIPATGQMGSSSMPRKSNPWRAERVCGAARLLRGNCMAQLESVAVWEERDMSHSIVERVALEDSFHLLLFMLRELGSILDHMEFLPTGLHHNASQPDGGHADLMKAREESGGYKEAWEAVASAK